MIKYIVFLFAFIAGHAQQLPCFQPDSLSPPATAYLPIGAAFGDFNRDGNKDIAVANVGGDVVSILLGNGNGKFQPAVNYNGFHSPRALWCADFNGDSQADLAVADHNAVCIMTGDGHGNFVTTHTIMQCTYPFALQGGDFNSDGLTDLAIDNTADDLVYIYVGTGVASFSLANTYTTAHTPYAFTSGDFNGDGKTDLALPNYNDNSVTLLVGSGNGNFTDMRIPVNDVVFSIAAGDFNRDGLDDIAVSGFQQVVTLQSSSALSFVQTNSISLNQGNVNLAAADLNGDGITDLAASNYQGKTAAVLVCHGNGSFDAPVFYNVGKGPLNVLVSDLNNDALPDIAVVNYNSDNLSIILNTSPPMKITGPRTVCTGQTATLTATGAASYSWTNIGSAPTITASPANSATYTVTGTSAAGCVRSQTIQLSSVSCTGIDEAHAAAFSIAPNPSQGVVHIRASGTHDVSVFSQCGALVRTFSGVSPHAVLDLSDLPRGLYVLRLTGNEAAGIIKLVLY